MVDYRVGIRNRGHGTRHVPPNNYHVAFPHDQSWRGIRAISFNTNYTHVELAARRSIAWRVWPPPTPRPSRSDQRRRTWPPQVSPCTAARMPVSKCIRWRLGRASISRDDPDGDAYKCIPATAPAGGRLCDIWAPARICIESRTSRQTMPVADDWSDLIQLTACSTAHQTPSMCRRSARSSTSRSGCVTCAGFPAGQCETGHRKRVPEMNTIMYRGVTDPRFVLIPHDLDTILDQGSTHGAVDQSVFTIVTGRPTPSDGVEGLKRFLGASANHPPDTTGTSGRHRDGLFARSNSIRCSIRSLGSVPAGGPHRRMKQFDRNQRAPRCWPRFRKPHDHDAPASAGRLSHTTRIPSRLPAQANAVTHPAGDRQRRAGRLDRLAGRRGPSPASASCPASTAWSFRPSTRTTRKSIVPASISGATPASATTKAGGTLGADETWTAAAGPYQVTGNVNIPAGTDSDHRAGHDGLSRRVSASPSMAGWWPRARSTGGFASRGCPARPPVGGFQIPGLQAGQHHCLCGPGIRRLAVCTGSPRATIAAAPSAPRPG